MTDQAIEAIRNQPADQLTFAWFRHAFMASHELKDELAYGHAVLDSVPKLDQYLWTYGPMIESQWEKIADQLAAIDPPTRLIDHGCGQGLAGLCINDVAPDLFGELEEIVLIEPSALALARAEAIYRQLAPDTAVTAINKRFDDLGEDDLLAAGDGSTVHVFSNSLDVLGFEPLKLLEKTLHTGTNTIISLSHDRSFDGGTPRIESVKAAVEHPDMAPQITVRRSTLDRFTCDSARRPPAVLWLCELEVHDD